MDEESELPKLTKADHIEMLKKMIDSYNGLPAHAMAQPVNHYDFCSLMLLVLAFFKDDNAS